MKKSILILVIAITISALFSSCSNEDVIQNNETLNVKVSANKNTIAGIDKVTVSEYGFLKFESPESYEEAVKQLSEMSKEELDNWEKSIGFVSSYSFYGISDFEENIPYTEDINANPELSIEGFKNSSYVDPLLLRIIDRYGIVQIGDFIFNSKIDDGYVLEIGSTDFAANYNDFKNGTFKADKMNMLTNEWDKNISENIDIFEYLKTGIKGLTLMSNKNMFHNKEVPDRSPTIVIDGSGTTYRADAKVSYQKAVFYFSLIAKLKYQRKGSGNLSPWVAVSTHMCFLTNYNLNMVTTCKYKAKKDSEKFPSPPHQNYQGMIDDNKLDWRAYHGGRKLEKYEMKAWFAYTDLNTVSTVTVYASLADGY
ncbi:hypothetical protein GCM10023210_39690 [Chryseobacterium ginsengisoli]|uniref:MACPF domain-containing protein n=1 Tax=Chryseobacterium ginsengisoli TaxID=363853 RepID=A0ABP9MWJ2_9FLAO